MNTRVCVQGSMGQGAFTGVPRVLSGVRKLLSMMDWQAGPGEAHEGVLGEEEAYTRRSKGVGEGEGRIRFGEVGPAEVAGDDDVVIILAPQSMVGASIYESLSEMVEKAEAQGTSTILINPDLVDRQSANGVMSVRGRSGRIAFAESFEEIYHFRLPYGGTTFMYPILGAVRMTRAHSDGDAGRDDALYVLHQRRESDKSEEYDPVGCTPGREPTVGEISALVPSTVDAILLRIGGSARLFISAVRHMPLNRSATLLGARHTAPAGLAKLAATSGLIRNRRSSSTPFSV